MSDLHNRLSFRGPRAILGRIKGYSQEAGKLGHRVRELVFGFRLRSTLDLDRWSLPAKLHRHRIVQRRRVFHQSGGNRSSIAQYALDKARHHRQQP